MSKYIDKVINENVNKVRLDHFQKLYNNKLEQFGIESADVLRTNVLGNVYNEIIKLTNPRNLLIVGKVQSGKTANLELLTSLLFENGYNIGIIYGGYDSKLLTQTINRFKETFYDPMNNFIILYNNKGEYKMKNFDVNQINNFLKIGKKIIFISMKNSSSISSITGLLKSIDTDNNKVFIVDDEGDQASLNTEFIKDKSSATYNSIVEMIDNCSAPLYLSVTATPQANIFSPDISRLKPNKLSLLYPGPDYHGANTFHVNHNYLKIIPDKSISTNHSLNPHIIDSLFHYIVSSSILRRYNELAKTNMIIHTSVKTVDHSNLDTTIKAKIASLRDYLETNPEVAYYEFLEHYNKYYKDSSEYSFEEIKESLKTITNQVTTVVHNSQGELTMPLEYVDYVINIGGNLLQRGVTFPNLVTIFFTRTAKNISNMDTTLQRARWFGYRNLTLKHTKIFTSREISQTFSELNDIENDLWEQFEEVISGDYSIDDIVISTDNLKLRPSRKNVTEVEKFMFKKRWINQRSGSFDLKDIQRLNQSVDNFIESNNWDEISTGHISDTTGKLSVVNIKNASNFFIENGSIFKSETFLETIEEICENYNEVHFIQMKNMNRVRTFNGSFISALKQGPDTSDLSKQKYKGDSSVIYDKDIPTVQIHKVIPKIDEVVELKFTQFMFSIYFPKKYNVYAGKNYDK